MRAFLIVMSIVDGLLFLLGVYLTVPAIDVAVRLNGAAGAVAIAALFFALPVFCLAAPFAAWRADRGQKGAVNVVPLALAPLVYAAFLMLYIFSV